jgi:hypothetical protein
MGRGWSGTALIAALVVMAAFPITWGFSLLLAPLSTGFSVVAWFRSRRDALFLTGVGLNVLLMLGFVIKLGELDISA